MIKWSYFFLFFAISATAETYFGSKMSLPNSKVMTLSTAIQNSSKNNPGQQLILFSARVEKVCKKKGCWMILKDGDLSARVTFKDYGFFVPTALIGQKVLVEGVLNKKEMTLKETKHFVEDGGGDPNKVKSPKTEFRVVASSVKILKLPHKAVE